MSNYYNITIFKDETEVFSKNFTDQQVVIGRQPEVHIPIFDASVSNLHAVIENRGGKFFVMALGSSQEIIYKGSKVTEVELNTSDSFNIGPFEIKFTGPEIKTESFNKTTVSKETIASNQVSDSSDNKGDLRLPALPDIEEPLNNEGQNKFLSEINEKVDQSDNNLAKQSFKKTLKKPTKKTFAPLAKHKNLEEIIKPSKGSVVEVIVTWRERILSSKHFSGKADVYIGNGKDVDVEIPISRQFKHKLVQISNSSAQVQLLPSMDSHFITSNETLTLEQMVKKNRSVVGSGVVLSQGEMLKASILKDEIMVYVRYVENAPRIIGAPVFDLSVSELMGVIASFAIVGLLTIYMIFTSLKELPNSDELDFENLKKATIEFKPPPKMIKPRDIPIPKKVEPPKKEKIVTKVTDKKRDKNVTKPDPTKKPKPKSDLKKGAKGSVKTADKKGTPRDVAPNDKKNKTNKEISNRPGGALGTGKKGANAQSAKRDVKKTGLLSTLSGGGVQKSLDKAYSGAGTTLGLSDKATGYSGQLSDREGDGIGTKLKNTGAGGSGTSTVGIAGVQSRGRGGGQTGYGGGGGLGGKGNSAEINLDGSGGEFSSSIDKEAVRRAIKRNKIVIGGCYEKALNKNKSLAGNVVLQWDIVSGGRAQNVSVKKSSLNNSIVESCLMRRIQNITFPSPGANETAKVSYPFVFVNQ